MRRQKVIVSSSDGKDAKGEHILTPTSIIAYQFADSTTTTTVAATDNNTTSSLSTLFEEEEVFLSRAIDTVRFFISPLWSRNLPDVVLPIQRLFDNVPLHAAFIRHWIKCSDVKGGLIFPRPIQDGESLEPIVMITKKATPLPESTSINVNISISMFRREIGVCADLQPFDASVWHSDRGTTSYDTWCHFYHKYAVVLDEESAVLGDARLPRTGICELFRRMMHTHFTDFGLVCGKLWFDFGLDEMVGEPLEHFMFVVLTEMFVKYNRKDIAVAALPPLSNASTFKGSGQHVCAKCLTFKLGSGKMMCCPCREVYYCCGECQTKDWKVHRVVCEFSGKKKKK